MGNLEQEKRNRREKSEKVRKWKGSWGHCLVPTLLPTKKFQFPEPLTSSLTSSWILSWCQLRVGRLLVSLFVEFCESFFFGGDEHFLFVLSFETRFDVAQMTSNLVCGRWWLWPSYPPAFISQVLGPRAWNSIVQGIQPRAFCVLSKHSELYPLN